jgi:hypothetical protein
MKLFAACALVVGIVWLTSPCPAAQTAWICTYSVQGFSRPVIVRYQIQDDHLVLNGKIRYRILQDNNVALIAVSSGAEIISTTPVIFTFTVMINKLSLAYRVVLVDMGMIIPATTAEGRCVTVSGGLPLPMMQAPEN